MWELIAANKRKSIFLFVCMGLCLLALGFAIGYAALPGNGGYIGLLVALCIWLGLSVIAYSSGDSIVLTLSKARQVDRDVHPQLFNVVEEMKIAANLPHMPKIYIIPDPAPNAFATGIKPEKSSIAITAGLLSRLNRDQLQGVIAHELSHIVNRDVLFMTFAGILLGSIVLISEIFLRGMWYSSGSSRRYSSGRSSKGGGQGQIIMLIVAIVFAVLAPLIARLLYFAMSRKREYLADASAVRLTRYPEGLASALEEISNTKLDLACANKVTAPMYIANPLKKKGRKLSNLTSTHPPITERIQILRNISQGVSYANYQEAYRIVTSGPAAIIPPSALQKTEAIPIRKASVDKRKREGKKKTTRDLGDLIRAVNKYAFLACVCGLRIKVPPDLKKSAIPCPRCGQQLAIPSAELATVGAMLGTVLAEKEGKSDQPAGTQASTYARKGTGWESFSCTCGKVLQISPSFSVPHVTCSKCGRNIEIINA